MKLTITFLIIITFCLNALSNDYVSGKLQHKEPAKQKTAVAGNTNVIQADSMAGYSINVNGRQNSVRITSDSLAVKNPETNAKPKIGSNSVAINGENNSVNIHQSKNSGQVNVKQKGSGNQVNISQTNQNTVK